MMGPLSVAQYLAPGEVSFDVVIMDEASQMRPEDSLGAIARCSQLIVVGDPKQLPPTSFFDRLNSDASEDEDEALTFGSQESILDRAASILGT
jgi:superfamily I DNA and/or RNA helicase